MANTKNAEGAMPFQGDNPPSYVAHDEEHYHHNMNPNVSNTEDLNFGPRGCSDPRCKASQTGVHAAPASTYVLGKNRPD